MTQVCWSNLNPEASQRGSWDQFIVEELTAGPDFLHREAERYDVTNFTHPKQVEKYGFLPNSDCEHGAVVVIAGQHNRWPEYAGPLTAFVASLPWALTIVTSDEEALFPVELLPHDDKHLIWGQYHARPEFDRVIPIGQPPDTKREHWRREITSGLGRDLDVFFAGQNTHARREELIDVMKDMATEPGHGNISWVASTGFRAGLTRDDYLACMARTRIAPCPSGYHSLDSFRLYEALAAGCIPIVENWTPDGHEPEFWATMFGTPCPIPRVNSWHTLPALVEEIQKIGPGESSWRDLREEIRAWWMDYQRDLAADFAATIARLQS